MPRPMTIEARNDDHETRILSPACLAGATAFAAPAAAQQATITQTIAGTRLDINATGEVTRVPDLAIISAGVVTRADDRRLGASAGGQPDGAGARGADPGRGRRPRHPDQQHQPQPRLCL